MTTAVPSAVEPEPLPSDDAPPVSPKPVPWRVGRLVLYGFGLALLAGGVFVGLQYRGGAVPSFVLVEAVAEDGSYRAVLPGAGRAAEVTPYLGTVFTKGERMVAGSPWTRIGGEVGQYRLPTGAENLVRVEDLLGELRDRRAGEWAATVENEAVVKVGPHDGTEVRLVNGSVRKVERYVLVRGSTPRVVFVSVGGPHFDPDGAIAKRVIGAFRFE